MQIYDAAADLRIVPTGAKQRALFGALVVRAGHVVPQDRLVDELWGEHPPANAANALQAHVARLRRLLPVPAPGSGEAHHEWLVTRPTGYALHLGRAGTDARRFAELAAEGRALGPAEPARSADVLRRALALWRGAALEGAGRGALCTAEAALLEEGRLGALEALYEACLSVGEDRRIAAELAELTAAHPLRERFYELLVTALYRCGRQAEALATYERAEHRLAQDLGIGPGPALRRAREAILGRQEPAGSGAGAGAGAGPGTRDGGGEVRLLREEIGRLRGEVERLTQEQRELRGRLDRLDRQDSVGRLDRPVMRDSLDRLDRQDSAGRLDRSAMRDSLDRLDRQDSAGRLDRLTARDRPARPEQPDCPDRLNRRDRPERPDPLDPLTPPAAAGF
ncbi:BTAD domain-containing putative transcriptional regulator [Streptomyces sp. NPDC049813]|uniref:BTAD domain-containing putative transcriptional regulator n=1 Tax=Streptomyces sp. NPDC049813 TaxID=3365597 RepID=UPI0037AC8714